MAANAGAIRAGRAFVELFADDTALVRGLNVARDRLKSFGASIQKIGASIGGLGLAIGTPLLGAAKAFADVGSNLQDMSQRTGISVESLSQLSFAAEQSGATMEGLETGVRKMQKAIGDAANGSKEARDAFTQIGVSVEDLAKLSPEEQFLRIADALDKIQNPTEKAAAAMKVLGKSGTALLPLITGGAEAVKKLMSEAAARGETITAADAAMAEKFGDTLSALKNSIIRATVAIGAALTPALQVAGTALSNAAANVGKWLDKNRDAVVAVGAVAIGLVALGAAITAVGVAVSTLGAGLGLVATTFVAIGTTVGALLTPLGLLAATLAGGAAAWFLFSDNGQAALQALGVTFGNFTTDAMAAFKGVVDALSAGDLALAGEVAFAGLNVAFQTGLAALSEIWFRFKDSVLSIWIDMRAAIQNIWVGMFAELSRAFPGLVEIAAKAGIAIKGIFQTIARKILELTGQITSEESAQAADQLAKDRANELKAAIEEINRAHDDPGKFVAEEQAKIEEARKKAQEARASGTAEDIKAAEAALEVARKKLAESVGRAAEVRKRADEARPGTVGPRTITAEIDTESIEKLKDAVRPPETLTQGSQAAALALLQNEQESIVAKQTKALADRLDKQFKALSSIDKHLEKSTVLDTANIA